MNIKTKEFQLGKKALFKIMIKDYFCHTCWIFSIGFIIIGCMLFQWDSPSAKILIMFGVLFPLFAVISFWRIVNSKENTGLFKKHFFEIDDNFISSYSTDGSMSKINLDDIIKVTKTSKYYLLYISQLSFIFLPLGIFHSSQDIDSLNLLLESKSKIKKAK